ncbi:Succinate dehydrogenase/fumarate reductase, flavoprotein subunit [Pseudomonas flavescens]|uniref:L-aspartate oxidase n=1 Tax=Phytopseudomonas flavescens TaxID=29435 RepID=A0A1G8KDP7_9GAMM|nr:FAD-binding protein [Pseudomonas flavescens]SDI41533.1 Succinate dehydrogenase/fumarate reductase, flavoprotein subunit [Pseudomonas flavescens]
MTTRPPLLLSADVLVIGGGLAGTWAAVAAAREGVRVVLAEKGFCGTSGVTATAGPGHWWVAPEQRQAAIDKRVASAAGLGDPHWMARILETTWHTLPSLDRLYHFPRNEQGEKQYRALRGPEYMGAMRQLAVEHGVTLLDHSPALELLKNDAGELAGARGLQRQQQRDWQVQAPAVVLSTGGCAFHSRLLGSQNNTGDGYLMGVEAGAELSGMEFSSYYCIAPANSTMTRSMVYTFGRYFDAGGRELAIAQGPDFNLSLARALLEGPVYCRLDRIPDDIRKRLPYVQPNLMLPFDRSGIDPYRDRFPVTLHGEGTVRGVGGLRLIDEHCQTRLPGLFAAGDAASREAVTGAISGGGAVNSSWALSSGQWAGRGAARHARQHPAGTVRTHGIARVGLLPVGAQRDDSAALIRTVQDEMHPYDKNLFRNGEQLQRSLDALDNAWDRLREQSRTRDTPARLRWRETAAMLATARWCYGSALARKESRGMHQRSDAPGQSADFDVHLHSGGLDAPWVRRSGLSERSDTRSGATA